MQGLKAIRKDAEMTQIELAKASKVSLATIRRIEAGKNVNVSVLKKIAHTLNCPVDNLIGKEEEKEGGAA